MRLLVSWVPSDLVYESAVRCSLETKGAFDGIVSAGARCSFDACRQLARQVLGQAGPVARTATAHLYPETRCNVWVRSIDLDGKLIGSQVRSPEVVTLGVIEVRFSERLEYRIEYGLCLPLGHADHAVSMGPHRSRDWAA